MRPHTRLAVALAATLLGTPILAAPLHARQSTQATAPDTAAAMPSVTLPPALDRVLRDYERHWAAGDGAALAQLFSEDGFVLQGGQLPIRGRAAIREMYGRQAGGALRLRALAFATADSIGYILGAYGYASSGPGDVGKFTLTLRRGPGGRWLIFSDMDNLNPRRRP
jgi:ketosteroid isomerase-like protein